MRESSFELAARLRSEAEALEELLIDSKDSHTFRSRQEEETKLEDLLNLAQDRLADLNGHLQEPVRIGQREDQEFVDVVQVREFLVERVPVVLPRGGEESEHEDPNRRSGR